MKEISLEEMLKSGVHFGHKVSRLYPKMKPFVFTDRNGVAIIDLEKTKQKMDEAREFVKKLGQNKGVILFVGTKRQVQDIIEKSAKEIGMPYVKERWIGGTFTNFSVILKMIDKFIKLKEQRERGELEKYTKKERLKINEEIERLDRIIGGIENMKKVPEAVYIVDINNENTALKEAKKRKIPIVAILDVNCNPQGIDYLIPANDDAIKSVELITTLLTEAYQEGLKSPAVSQKEEVIIDKKTDKKDIIKEEKKNNSK